MRAALLGLHPPIWCYPSDDMKYGKQTNAQCGCVVVWQGASLMRPSALRSGPLGDFVATHDVSVSPRNRQKVTKKS